MIRLRRKLQRPSLRCPASHRTPPAYWIYYIVLMLYYSFANAWISYCRSVVGQGGSPKCPLQFLPARVKIEALRNVDMYLSSITIKYKYYITPFLICSAAFCSPPPTRLSDAGTPASAPPLLCHTSPTFLLPSSSSISPLWLPHLTSTLTALSSIAFLRRPCEICCQGSSSVSIFLLLSITFPFRGWIFLIWSEFSRSRPILRSTFPYPLVLTTLYFKFPYF